MDNAICWSEVVLFILGVAVSQVKRLCVAQRRSCWKELLVFLVVERLFKTFLLLLMMTRIFLYDGSESWYVAVQLTCRLTKYGFVVYWWGNSDVEIFLYKYQLSHVNYETENVIYIHISPKFGYISDGIIISIPHYRLMKFSREDSLINTNHLNLNY